jgi:cobalamin biosynthesis Mg chelatase CobN
MIGMRHPPARRAALPAFWLPLVLALLALAAFPVLSQADSSGYQYTPEVPTVTGHESSPTKSGNAHAKGSKAGGGAQSNQSATPAVPGSGSSNGPNSGGGAVTGNGGQGNPAGGSAGKPQSGNGGGKANLQEEKPVSNPTESSDGGSSSPLVPILIVIALLAAGSIGAVVYRQRRQRPAISPKAS